MKRWSIIILLLAFGFLPVRAQEPLPCAEAAANAAQILTNVEELLAQGNTAGAATLLNIARDLLQTCEDAPSNDTSDAANIATTTPPPAPVASITPVPTIVATVTPLPPSTTPVPPTATSVPTAAPIAGNFTVNQPAVEESQGVAFVRFAHTSVDGGPVDMFMDGVDTPIVTNLSYGEATGLLWVRSGGRTFTARQAGAGTNGAELDVLRWNFPSNSSWTVAAIGLREDETFAVEPFNSIRNNYDGQARVRVINLVPGGPRLTVEDSTGRVYGDRLPWVRLRDTMVPPGSYSLNIRTDDNRATESNIPFEFAAQTTTTLLAMGAGTPEQPVTLLSFTDEQELTRVRFINGGASPVEIYMRPGNQLLVSILDPASETEFFTLPSGAATFTSFAPGTGPGGRQLAGLPWQLRPGRDMTIRVLPDRMEVTDISLRIGD